MEYIRLKDVCKTVLLNNTVLTDSAGYAIFQTLTILRGPIGIYGFAFQAYVAGQQFNSDGYDLVLTSNITTLTIMTPPPFQYDLTGDPSSIINRFPVQPVVRILDYLGMPISNKYVIAYTWPEPILGGWGSTYNLQGMEK